MRVPPIVTFPLKLPVSAVILVALTSEIPPILASSGSKTMEAVPIVSVPVILASPRVTKLASE